MHIFRMKLSSGAPEGLMIILASIPIWDMCRECLQVVYFVNKFKFLQIDLKYFNFLVLLNQVIP